MTEPHRPPSPVEGIKTGSRQLRGHLSQTLHTGVAGFDEPDRQVLKFHGVYQQADRDRRGQKPPPTFMVRSRIPGGVLTPAQYLAHDRLAGDVANGTLRITTRQALQLHGVIKGDLQATLRTINDTLLTTLGACGDVVRNIIVSPAPPQNEAEGEVLAIARLLADRVLPRTRAYHEVWLDGEKQPSVDTTPDEPDPLYGQSYLPRKFKIAVAVGGDNSVDVFAHDVGLIARIRQGRLTGFLVLAGGGMGMTHRKSETFPRLADPVAEVAPEEVIEVVEAIIAVQRDHGDRSNRRHARLKYLIHDHGIDWLRTAVEARLGRPLRRPRRLPALELGLHHGWKRQANGRWSLGLFIENGRIRDNGDARVRSGLRAIVEQVRPGMRLTPHQDVLLVEIDKRDRPRVDRMLDAFGIPRPDALTVLRRHSMACPALPTCGLAITEAERRLPDLIDELEFELVRLGLPDEVLTVRMTGCPNGCARPYVADVGLVGRSLDKYTLFVGGSSDGTRLNTPYADLVPADAIVRELEPLLVWFRDDRLSGESFGDFTARVGVEALREFASAYRREGSTSGRSLAVAQ